MSKGMTFNNFFHYLFLEIASVNYVLYIISTTKSLKLLLSDKYFRLGRVQEIINYFRIHFLTNLFEETSIWENKGNGKGVLTRCIIWPACSSPQGNGLMKMTDTPWKYVSKHLPLFYKTCSKLEGRYSGGHFQLLPL